MEKRPALGRVAALVSAALLAGFPPFAGAGHGGGHGGGGGHGVAGFHGGGFHPGGFHGRGFYGHGFYGRGFYGGYYPGFYGYGYPWWYGGFGLGLGLGYGLGYGSGYGYPYYPYAGPAYAAPPICVAPAPPAGAAPAVPAGAVQVAAGEVRFVIRVPDGADVWINGEKTTQSGPQREFVSSGLEQGRTYTYDVRARWPAPDGTTVQLERRVPVHGGERRTVDFLVPATGTGPVRN